MFSKNSKAILYGRHLDVAQRMLDFDFISDRGPSVGGLIDPSQGKKGVTKLFFGKKEILVPVYGNISDIAEDVTIDTFINLASFRSATEATWGAIRSEKFKHIVIIAEGIPEREIREIIAHNNAEENPLTIIGPATAGVIVGGTLRMGNAGGSLENIVESRLYLKGSIGFVSKSGGMSNEMYRVISKRTDGIHTGIALGGDRFTGSIFSDIILEYEKNPEIKMIVMLGEVGGRDELDIAKLISEKKITKPVVAYVSGSFAEHLKTEVQFGHAGAKANAKEESASYKNEELRRSGAHVPESYADFGDLIENVFNSVTPKNNRVQISENTEHRLLRTPRVLPTLREGASSQGQKSEIEKKLEFLKQRKSTIFTSTISDERNEEVTYNKKSLESYVGDGSIAKVIANLWLKRDLPDSALDFINTIIILLADHGPAVSGATNTIITARAGKDILSSLLSGLLTIGPRFGGAIDGAAHEFYHAVQNSENPVEFITRMKKSGNPIPGIGHKVKSKWNPDGRCDILKSKAKNIGNGSYGKYLQYALEVESLTLEKKSNLILNVDGHIATILLDIFESIGMNDEEIRMYIEAGLFNAFFILARSIGFIGHALDQKRLGEPLYRTSWDDIHYGE